MANIILNLPSNKAPGFDKVPARILKDSLPATLQIITSLMEGDIGVCGIAVLVNFSYGISVILILNCVIAVFSESAG